MAIESIGQSLKKFAFEDHILFAEVNDHPGELVAILPHLLCKELKANGKIQAKRAKGATPFSKDIRSKLDNEKENLNMKTKEALLFVQSNNPGITTAKKGLYDGKPLCVVARGEESLTDAFSNDGRFSNDIMLYEESDRKSEIPLHYEAVKFSKQVLVMKRRTRKRKANDEDSPDLPECSDTETLSLALLSTIETPFTEDIRKAMVEHARNSAMEILIGPGVPKDKLDEKLKTVATKFGKVASAAMPARILPILTEASKAVGFIKCGDCAGTCFLLTKHRIITCQHVINDIYTKRSQCTDHEVYKTISIYFNYEYPQNYGSPSAEIQEEHIVSGQVGPGMPDYAICVIKWISEDYNEEDITPLGPMVRSALPHDGLVMLVGHPNSKHKSFETCRILPGYNWHSTLCRRGLEAEQFCNEHPEQCLIHNDRSQRCVHFFRGRYQKELHPDELPYDTSFFEGSSGSPVFNAYGHIVAMHTQGYSFWQNEKKVSLMEFGFTFGAIYRDVEKRWGMRAAKKLFPNCS